MRTKMQHQVQQSLAVADVETTHKDDNDFVQARVWAGSLKHPGLRPGIIGWVSVTSVSVSPQTASVASGRESQLPPRTLPCRTVIYYYCIVVCFPPPPFLLSCFSLEVTRSPHPSVEASFPLIKTPKHLVERRCVESSSVKAHQLLQLGVSQPCHHHLLLLRTGVHGRSCAPFCLIVIAGHVCSNLLLQE